MMTDMDYIKFYIDNMMEHDEFSDGFEGDFIESVYNLLKKQQAEIAVLQKTQFKQTKVMEKMVSRIVELCGGQWNE